MLFTVSLCTQIPFFEDVGAMTLQYLDSLVQRDNLQKSQFFKGLPQVIAKMPKVCSFLVLIWKGICFIYPAKFSMFVSSCAPLHFLSASWTPEDSPLRYEGNHQQGHGPFHFAQYYHFVGTGDWAGIRQTDPPWTGASLQDTRTSSSAYSRFLNHLLGLRFEWISYKNKNAHIVFCLLMHLWVFSFVAGDADISAEHEPSAEQDSPKRYQKPRTAHGVQSSGGKHTSDPGTSLHRNCSEHAQFCEQIFSMRWEISDLCFRNWLWAFCRPSPTCWTTRQWKTQSYRE